MRLANCCVVVIGKEKRATKVCGVMFRVKLW
jgi:hypothetical protein